jgi:hypothetical protein
MKPALVLVSDDMNEAWMDFAAKQMKAKESLRMADAAAAGVAWKHFLDVCAGEELRARTGA